MELRDRPLEKLWGGRGIFEAQEFSSLSNSLYEFFLGHSMYIFRVNWRARIFFHLIFPSANFFFVLRTPPPPPPPRFLMVRP